MATHGWDSAGTAAGLAAAVRPCRRREASATAGDRHVAGGGGSAAGRGGGMMSCMTSDGTDQQAGDLDRSVSGMLRIRGVVIGVLVTVFLALPAVSLFRQHGLSGVAAFLVPGTAVFVVLVDRWLLVSRPQLSHHPVRDVAVM